MQSSTVRGFAVACFLSALAAAGEPPGRPWTAADSVAIRYFITDWGDMAPAAISREQQYGDSLAQFSPDGRYVYFGSVRGDLNKDEAVFEVSWYRTADIERALAGPLPANQAGLAPFRTLAMGNGTADARVHPAVMSRLHWENDHVFRFVGVSGQTRRLYRYEIEHDRLTALTEPEYRPLSFAYEWRNSTIVFSTLGESMNYREPLERYPVSSLGNRKLRGLSANFTRQTYIRLHASYRGAPVRPLAEGSELYGGPWISPDERWAVVAFMPKGAAPPEQWSEYRFGKAMIWRVLIDLQSGAAQLLAPCGPQPFYDRVINSLFEANWQPFWSADGRHLLLLNSALPLEAGYPQRRTTSYAIDYDLLTGAQRVIEPFAAMGDGRIGEVAMLEEGKSVLVVHRDEKDRNRRVASRLYRFDGKGWTTAAAGQRDLPAAVKPTAGFDLQLRQSANEPPRVVAVKGARELQLSAPDPALAGLHFAPVDVIHWRDAKGRVVESLLTLPPGYSKGNPVRLVVQLADPLNPSGMFLPDGEVGTAFAAQALAAQGFAVLQTEPAGSINNEGLMEEEPGVYYTPDEGPSQVRRVDEAVQMLRDRGVEVDGPIGLIGFSRSGYYTYYIATHPGKTTVGAAIVFDSITCSFGDYITFGAWEGIGSVGHYAAQYGKGNFWQNKQGWLDAPEFNLEKLKGPVLFHITGAPEFAATTIGAFEHARRPYDYLNYPQGNHQLYMPRQRVAALQSTLDWMGFWLQGKERDAVDAPGRFESWRKVRENWRKVLAEEGGG